MVFYRNPFIRFAVLLFVLAWGVTAAAIIFYGNYQDVAALRTNRQIASEALFTRANDNLEAGLLEAAKQLLLQIGPDFPYYEDVKNKLEEINGRLTEEKISAAIEKVSAEFKKETDKAQKTAEAAQRAANIAEEEAAKERARARQADLSYIINQWQPRLGHVRCEFRNRAGVPYAYNAGSGLAVYAADGTVQVVTNKHIVDSFGRPAYSCTANFNNGYVSAIAYSNPTVTSAIKISDSSDDWGIIRIDNPDSKLKQTVTDDFKRCTRKASIGDSVVILGYPGIGSQDGITATQGIISGYDGNYYITDAKIEHGNSGGATILLKDNCYLGIPTFVVVGQIESLARILDQNVIFSE